MTCAKHCDDLLDELTRLRAELTEARKQVEARTWERDHAVASYQRLLRDYTDLQREHFAPEAAGDG